MDILSLLDVASCPAGALMGSVTTQISAIHLTRQGQPASVSSSSPLPSSPSPTEECQVGETHLSGWATANCFSISRCTSVFFPPSDSHSEYFTSIWIVSSQECVMQVDGVEEELPDELENACSDDGKMLKYTHTHTHTLRLIIHSLSTSSYSSCL